MSKILQEKDENKKNKAKGRKQESELAQSGKLKKNIRNAECTEKSRIKENALNNIRNAKESEMFKEHLGLRLYCKSFSLK